MFITIAYSFNNHASFGDVFASQCTMVEYYENWVDHVNNPIWEKQSGWTLDDWNKSKSPDYKGDAFVYFNDCVMGMLLVDATGRKPAIEQMNASKRVIGYEITPEQANQIIADYGDCSYQVPYAELQHDDGSLYVIMAYNYEYGHVMSVHSSEESMLVHAQHIWAYGDLDELTSGLVATPQWREPLRQLPMDDPKYDYIGEYIPYMPIADMDRRERDATDGPFYNTIVGFRVQINEVDKLR